MSNQPNTQQQLLSILRDKAWGQGLLNQVRTLAGQVAERLERPPVVMEVCGTHTAAMATSGLRPLLKDLVELRSGPGCPVCVTQIGRAHV